MVSVLGVVLPDSIKNISGKSFDLLSEKNVLKNISFHQSCKCDCLLDKKVCNNLQKGNKDKFRCECLKIKKCAIGYSWNVNNYRFEMKKLAALIESERFHESEERKEITDNVINYDCTVRNKTLIKKIKDGKPFIGISILFLCITIILIGIMIYFCLKLKK